MQTEEEKEEKDFQPDGVSGYRVLPFETIKKRSDFGKLRKKGKVLKNKYLIIYILPQCKGKSLRAGFGVSKKLGKAFLRNKIRRVLKEILRKVLIPYAIDVYIIARYTMAGASYSEIAKELKNSLNSFFLST